MCVCVFLFQHMSDCSGLLGISEATGFANTTNYNKFPWLL